MRRKWPLAAALLVVAVNLRLGVAAVPPLLNQIRATTGLSAAGGGLLTGLPVFCFGIAALAAPRLIRRFSMGPLVTLTLAVIACGCALRLIPSLPALFIGTAVLGCGIAVGNVLLPGLIKRDFPTQRVLMTALYSVSLAGGAAIASGLTVPIEHATGLGWRGAIAIWGLAAVIAIVLWSPQVHHEHQRVGAGSEGEPVPGLWRDPLAWCVSGFMGLQSFGFYATLSWLPTILEDHGHVGRARRLDALVRDLLRHVRRADGAKPRAAHATAESAGRALCDALCRCAMSACSSSPASGTYLWCALLGLGQGAPLALALGYIVDRAPDSNHAAHLSTMAQSVGYLIASAGPFVMGALHGISGQLDAAADRAAGRRWSRCC